MKQNRPLLGSLFPWNAWDNFLPAFILNTARWYLWRHSSATWEKYPDNLLKIRLHSPDISVNLRDMIEFFHETTTFANTTTTIYFLYFLKFGSRFQFGHNFVALQWKLSHRKQQDVSVASLLKACGDFHCEVPTESKFKGQSNCVNLSKGWYL